MWWRYIYKSLVLNSTPNNLLETERMLFHFTLRKQQIEDVSPYL
jgi:hypothetical protein